MSIESMIYLILCHPLLLLTSLFPSIRVFSNELALHVRWPKCWSFSFSINTSNEYSGLISFKVTWIDFLAVQGTLMSLLQDNISEASMLWCSALFMVQLSHLYMTAGKTVVLTYGPLLAKWCLFFSGASENEMVRQHHQLNGHEVEQTPGDSEGQGSGGSCWDVPSPWQVHETREEPARQLFLTWGCPGGPVCPLRSRRDEKGTCKAALPLEAVPGAGMSLPSYCLAVVGLSINFWKW